MPDCKMPCGTCICDIILVLKIASYQAKIFMFLKYSLPYIFKRNHSHVCFSNGSDHLPIIYFEKLSILFHNFLSNQLNGEKVDTPIEGEKKFNLISNPSVIDLTKGK